MKTRSLLLFFSLPILLFSCAEQASNDCQKHIDQIESLKEELAQRDSVINSHSSFVCNLLASPYDHVAEVKCRPINSDSTAMDYEFIYSIYVPRSVRLNSVNFNPSEPGVIWEVNVTADSVSLSEEPYDRWEIDTLIVPNNMTKIDVDGDGQVTHWNDDYPNVKGELDQNSAFLLKIIGADGLEKSRTAYPLKKAQIRSF